MADKVQGKNIMLYNTSYNVEYYFNGGINSTVIDSVTYKDLNQYETDGSLVILSRTGDGLVAGFITDDGVPNSDIKAGTWTFTNYMALSENISGSPVYYIKVLKYNGTSLTLLATSESYPFIATGLRTYTTDIVFGDVSLSSNDRIAVEIWSENVDERITEIYTQGEQVNTVITTFPQDVAFACSTNCSFSVNVDQKEVTSQTSAWYREYKNDIASWSITCDGLITLDGYGYLFLLQQQQDRTQINIKFVIDNGVDGLVIISGKCNLTSLQINAPYKDIATYSVSLQGSGAYGTSGTSINPSGVVIIAGGAVYTKGTTAAGGETTITYSDMIGKSCLYVSRGGIDVQAILSSGTPIDEQVKWVSATGILTFSRALESGEFVRSLFQ
jgi:predicted secreted protein